MEWKRQGVVGHPAKCARRKTSLSGDGKITTVVLGGNATHDVVVHGSKEQKDFRLRKIFKRDTSGNFISLGLEIVEN